MAPHMFKRKVHILFLDSENVCQSQIAQAIAMQIGADRLHVKSAGINAGKVHCNVKTVMQRIDMNILSQKPMRVSSELLRWSDTVITLSEYAKTHCPTMPVGTQLTHWSLSIQSLSGTQKEIELAYDQLRQKIQQRIEGLLGGLTMINR